MSISVNYSPNRHFMLLTILCAIVLGVMVISHLVANYFNFSRLYYVGMVAFISATSLAVYYGFLSFSMLRLRGFAPYLILLAGWSCYFLFAGQFDAVPADFIFHLNNIKYALIELEHWDTFKFVGSWYSAKGNHYGYLPFALQVWFLDLKPYELYAFWAWFNPLIFLFAVYEFANFLFWRIISSEQQVRFFAVVATLSLPFLLGIDSFSYVRAYSSAAALWGFILFLFASYLVIRFYDELQYGVKKVGIYAALFLITVFVQFLMHPQEAVFSVIMAFAMTIVVFLRSFMERKRGSRTLMRWFWPAIVFLMFVSFVLSGLVAARLLPLSGQPAQHLFSLSFGDAQFYITNLETQLHRVLGFQGTLVMLTALVTWPLWKKHSYFLAILVVPFITVLNPLFVHAMTYASSSGILYRFFFLLQPYLFFAIILYAAFAWLSRKLPGVRSWVRTGVIAFFGMFFLVGAKPDKLPTLMPLHTSESSRHWADLWEFMDSLEEFKEVLTDPVTGYMVNGFTRQYFEGFKFHGGALDKALTSKNNIEQKVSYLIINRRDGGGEFTWNAGHWSSDVLELSKYYSKDFLEYVASNTKHFQAIWKSEDDLITVYLIKG